MEKAGREEEEEEMAEAVGPSRLKHWADEASVKRGRGRGSFECASTILKVIIDFAAKFPLCTCLCIHTSTRTYVHSQDVYALETIL